MLGCQHVAQLRRPQKPALQRPLLQTQRRRAATEVDCQAQVEWSGGRGWVRWLVSVWCESGGSGRNKRLGWLRPSKLHLHAFGCILPRMTVAGSRSQSKGAGQRSQGATQGQRQRHAGGERGGLFAETSELESALVAGACRATCTCGSGLARL